ncbi:molybdopterin synthase catalytic subunit [Gellertiella hungarica]|uniref:Molybdopterin synthase catalytic subunit n=1 Tax=Gellertiella hungarica TaxID=1572859 RepID=A0A7W6J673_9HYPH|nr:molybdopterin synthase catalytic subunit [Gellertiella hungarica]
MPSILRPIVSVQREDIDTRAIVHALTDGRTDVGALVTFTGLCRDEAGRLEALELEHYPGMAEAELTRIGEEAIGRFALLGLAIVHRYGRMEPSDQIVLVAATSSHRQAAFDGANFVMDYLKTSAPFWKKEHGRDGTEGGWVAARDADDTARLRWKQD